MLPAHDVCCKRHKHFPPILLLYATTCLQVYSDRGRLVRCCGQQSGMLSFAVLYPSTSRGPLSHRDAAMKYIDESLAETCGNPQTDDNSCLLGSNSLVCVWLLLLLVFLAWQLLGGWKCISKEGIARDDVPGSPVCLFSLTHSLLNTLHSPPVCVVAHSYRRTLPDNTVQRVLGWATSLGGAAPDVVVLTAQEKEAIDSSGGGTNQSSG